MDERREVRPFDWVHRPVRQTRRGRVRSIRYRHQGLGIRESEERDRQLVEEAALGADGAELIRSRERLDEDGMVAALDQLGEALDAQDIAEVDQQLVVV